MKKSKIIETILNLMAAIGIICFILAASTCDYYDSIGQYYALSNFNKQLIIGALLILPRALWRD